MSCGHWRRKGSGARHLSGVFLVGAFRKANDMKKMTHLRLPDRHVSRGVPQKTLPQPGLGTDLQSDADLVEAVLGGNRASFAVLVRRHERAALVAALTVLRDHHAAQDAAQDAFVAAFEQLGTLRHGAKFGPWILGIARRRAIDLWRKQSRSGRKTVSLDSIAEQPDRRLDQTVLDEGVEDVFDAIGRLPERLGRVLLLRYCDGLSVREISESTGSPVGTVTSRLSRALTRLRKILATLSKES